MSTSDTDHRTESHEKVEVLAPPKSFDDLRRQTGSGGFVSIASICGKVGKPRRPRRPLYRHTLHAGR